MTVVETTYIGPYNIDAALNLLSPVDHGLRIGGGGCCESLVLLVKKLATFICRAIHFLCCDWTWYNNCTARRIVELYLDGHERNPILDQKVRNLYQAICLRANGESSYADSLPIERINEAEATPIQTAFVPSEEQASIEILSSDHASDILRDQKNELQRQLFECLQHLVFQSDDYYFCQDLFDFVEENAFIYPEDAKAIAGCIEHNYFREKTRCVFLEARARTNLQEALETIDDIPISNRNTIDALLNIIQHLEPTHEEQIELLIQKALVRIASWGPPVQVLSLCSFAKVRAQTNEQKAHELCLRALEVAENMTSMDHKLYALSKIACTQVKIHSPTAISTINRVLMLIESSREDKEKRTCDILPALARIDVDRALEIAHGLEHKKDFAIFQVIRAQAKENPEKAKTILEVENLIEWKAYTQKKVIEALLPTHSEEALAVADQMTRKERRGVSTYDNSNLVDGALTKIVKAIAQESPDLALELVKRMDKWHCYRGIRELLKALMHAPAETADPIFQEIHALINPMPVFKVEALAELASAQFRTDPILANQIFDEAITIARCTSDFCKIAKAQENGFPEKAMANYHHAFNRVKDLSPSIDSTEERSEEHQRVIGEHFRRLGAIYNALAERPQPKISRRSSIFVQ